MKKQTELKTFSSFLLILLLFLPLLYEIASLIYISLINFEHFRQAILLSISTLNLLFTSIMASILIALLATVLGFFYFILLILCENKFRDLLLILLAVPLAMGTPLYALYLLAFFGEVELLVNTFTLPTARIPVELYGNFYYYCFVEALGLSLLSFLLLLLIFRFIGENFVKSLSLYKKRLGIKKILLILLYATRSPLLLTFLILFSFSIADYATPHLLAINTFQGEIFSQISSYNWRYAELLSLYYLALFIPPIAIFHKVTSKFTIKPGMLERQAFLKVKSYMFTPLAFFGILGVVPYLLMINESNFLNPTFVQIIEDNGLILLKTVIVSTFAAFLMSFIAFIIYLSYEQKFMIFLVSLAILPKPVIGLAILRFFSDLGIGTNYIILLYGYLLGYLPLTLLFTLALLSQFRTSFNSIHLYTPSFSNKIRIALCFSKDKLIIFTILLTFLLLMDLNITQLLAPPTFEHAFIKAVNFYHYGNHRVACTILSILTLFKLMLLFYAFKKL